MAAVAALLTGLVVAACGSANVPVTTGTYTGEGGVGAPYLEVGSLVYEVQISRALNPYSAEDSAYLEGVPASERELKPGEEWFGVFIKVWNETKSPHPDVGDITVSDTEGNVYHPITTESTNLYEYRPGVVEPKGEVPQPGSTAYYGPTGGALLLYKIKLESLNNRPLEINIPSPTDPQKVVAKAELDV